LLQLPTIRVAFWLAVLLALLTSTALFAQDDATETPLGDIARELRKKNPPSRAVIDDDNLSTVMAEAGKQHGSGSALRFLMAGEGKGFQLSAPDVTCNLSFTANAKSLLAKQYAQMELPEDQLLKLEGPAAIEADALTISVFNGTDWHVSEVTVALTVLKKPVAGDLFSSYGELRVTPGPVNKLAESEVHPEKKPDTTVIYRMRAAAPPSVTTVFSSRLNLELAPDEEWHWAIVEAKGYPPQDYASGKPQTPGQGKDSEMLRPRTFPLLGAQSSAAADAAVDTP
jgi:hypothetical protein